MEKCRSGAFVPLLVGVDQENQGYVEPQNDLAAPRVKKIPANGDTLVRGSKNVAKATCSRR
jgi:hypothetical protein